MYSWKGDALAKLLLVMLVLVIVVNSGIIIGIQLMAAYPYGSLAETKAAYTSHTVIDQSGDAALSAFLLSASGNENRLIVTEKHFAANRYRVILDTEIGRDYSAQVKAHCGTVSVRLEGNKQITALSFRGASLPIHFGLLRMRVPVSFLLWNLLVLTIEILAAYLFHRIRSS